MFGFINSRDFSSKFPARIVLLYFSSVASQPLWHEAYDYQHMKGNQRNNLASKLKIEPASDGLPRNTTFQQGRQCYHLFSPANYDNGVLCQQARKGMRSGFFAERLDWVLLYWLHNFLRRPLFQIDLVEARASTCFSFE